MLNLSRSVIAGSDEPGCSPEPTAIVAMGTLVIPVAALADPAPPTLQAKPAVQSGLRPQRLVAIRERLS